MPPTLAARHDALPIEWAQNWAHKFSDAANHSEISTFRGRPQLALGAGGRWFESSRPDQNSWVYSGHMGDRLFRPPASG